MPVQIITDSSTDLAPDFRPKPEVLPLTIHFGSQSFLDGVELSHRGFYERLVESDQLPTTSQATPYAFSQAFARARQAGRQVVAITISAKLSGTYQSAVLETKTGRVIRLKGQRRGADGYVEVDFTVTVGSKEG